MAAATQECKRVGHSVGDRFKICGTAKKRRVSNVQPNSMGELIIHNIEVNKDSIKIMYT